MEFELSSNALRAGLFRDCRCWSLSARAASPGLSCGTALKSDQGGMVCVFSLIPENGAIVPGRLPLPDEAVRSRVGPCALPVLSAYI